MDLFKRIIKHKRWFILVPIALSLLILLPLTKAKVNPDLMEYLPNDIESKINLDSIEREFGKFEPLIIYIKSNDILQPSTLERIVSLSEALSELPEVNDVLSLHNTKYIRGVDGAMLVDPAIRFIPTNEEEREALKQELTKNPLAVDVFVSSSFKHASIIVNPEQGITDETLLQKVDSVLMVYPGNESVYMNGLPYLRNEIQVKATRDLALLLPLGLVVMLVFLLFSFREIKGVLLPFSVVLMSIAFAMGLMPLLGYDLSLIAVLVPIMMIAIANNYGVHIIARYQELNSDIPSLPMPQIVERTLKHLTKPILLTAITTIIGILGLAVHVMAPARQMGWVTSVGVAVALVLSLVFIPSVMLGMKKGKPFHGKLTFERAWIRKLLAQISLKTVSRPLVVVYIFVSFLLLSAVGILSLQVSINMEKMMPQAHPMRISTDIANQHFGGTKTISMLFEGDIISPEVMQTMDVFERELKQIPEVGNVTSLASVIRIISRSLNNPDDILYDTIPNDRMAIAQYIEFYSMSGDPEDFEKLVNFDYSQALLNIQFKANDYKAFKRVVGKINALANSSTHCTLMAGQCLVENELARSIVRGQVYSLIFAMLAIVSLLAIIFKSVTAGIIGSIPLLVSLICNFGLMGWFGLELDIGNSLISSVAIGIGVDYAIHLFWRLKYELSLGRSYSSAIANTLTTTGRGITINALSVMLGFAVLFFSGLVILKTFAFLIIFSLLICLLCTLILIPAICIFVQPAFLTMNGNQQLFD